MIEQTVEELTPIIGTRPACRALGVAPATIYRRRRPPQPKPRRARPAPPRALSDAEREAVLGQLRSERFVDCAPAQVYATLLDEGRYLCSERTMYRLLDASGEVRERRDQLTHPAYNKPELLAEAPNQVWSWDIEQAERPREVDPLPAVRDPRHLQPLRRRLDGPVSRGQAGRQSADRASVRAAADHARQPDGTRRSRQRDALQAGRVPARGPRPPPSP